MDLLFKRLLLSLIVLTAFQPALQAQCTLRKIPCDKISVDICAANTSALRCQDGSFTPPNCRRVQFRVALTVTGATTYANTTICLDYTQLEILTLLTVSDAEFGIPISRIDSLSSVACSGGFNWADNLLVSPADGEVSLSINSSSPPEISLHLDGSGNGYVHLFTVVVNAWPDETIALNCGGIIYSTTESLGLGLLDGAPTDYIPVPTRAQKIQMMQFPVPAIILQSFPL